MRMRRWFPMIWGVVLIGAPATAAEKAVPAPRVPAEERMRRDITFLASDQCEGRGPGTNGIDKAADYIAAEFRKIGLKPAGIDGSYFQPFTIPANVLDEPAHLALFGPRGQQIELRQGAQFWPMGLGGRGGDKAAVVFAGFGITSAEADYDDYADVDVADKIVVLLRGSPKPADRKLFRQMGNGAPFVRKVANAQKHQAAAVLIVNDVETARDGDELLDFNYTAFGENPATIPVCHIRRSVLEMMLTGGADELLKLEQSICHELRPHSRELAGWKISVEVKMSRGKWDVKNIVGELPGAGPLAGETVVVGAHYDHLGYGGVSSLAGLKKMAIHHGADDNGSGTTTVLELARRFASMKNRQGRRLVFITFSGEELGLLGSRYYCKHPLYPLESTAAMFNLDMVGRLRPDKTSGKPRLLTEGSGTAKPFRPLLDRLARKFDFTMVNKASGLGPSDHDSFCRKGIPVLFVWTNYHEDYHRPTDTADKINVAGMRRIADLTQEAITSLTQMDKPAFVKVKEQSGPSKYSGPTLGIVPDYGDEGEGLTIGGVADGRPADKAGLQADDRIVEIAGRPVKNIQTYMTAMAKHKKGETIEVRFIRNGKKMTVKVKLE